MDNEFLVDKWFMLQLAGVILLGAADYFYVWARGRNKSRRQLLKEASQKAVGQLQVMLVVTVIYKLWKG